MQKYERHAQTAPAVRVNVGLDSAILEPRLFKTGSAGWYASKKLLIEGELCQCSFTCTIIGSKPSEPQANGTPPESGKSRRKKAAPSPAAPDQGQKPA